MENLEGFGKPQTDRQKSSKTAVGCETGSGRKTVISGIHSKLPHVPGTTKRNVVFQDFTGFGLNGSSVFETTKHEDSGTDPNDDNKNRSKIRPP